MAEPCEQMSRKNKSVEERYKRMEHKEHILARPDSYVGSCQPHELELWIHDGEKMVFKTMTIVPALYKIFDEVLVNAADNKVNHPEMNELRVEVNQEACRISVWNNGEGIPVQMHQIYEMYVPQLIFGELLTSDNYDDTEEKVTGGRNGYGAKLANIYSTKFTIETCDAINMKKYKQIFRNNMSEKGEPDIKDIKKKDSWTKVTFEPDLARFGMTRLDDNMVSLIRKRTYDMAGVLGAKNLKVFFNGTRLKVKNFQDYVDLYLGPRSPDTPRVYAQVNNRWEVCVAPGDGDRMQQVAFVNAICTSRGGKHVDHVVKQITDKLVEEVGKKTKTKGVLKPSHVRNHLRVFLNCQINNPGFDSQTKENLTSNISTFGSKCDINEDFMKKLKRSGIMSQLEDLVKFRGQQALKKTDGSKRSRIYVPKLEDAHEAGSKNSDNCTLILTEGDSAKAFAMTGLQLVGRQRYGVFPLRGKLLNVREATDAVVSKNAEIQNIKKILGLQHGKVYNDTKALRYGHVMIMADQDHDGSHIKGLIINFFHKFYPSLLKTQNFMQCFVTPIVKVTKKTGSKEVLSFYTMPEYQAWRETVDPSKYVIKYYKGLGSSTAKEAKENFASLDANQKLFFHNGNEDDNAIDKAFSKLRTEERKQWLNAYQQGTYLDHSVSAFTYSDFVDKELILFSRADVGRSIPSILDGLKPVQRKILYCCFKRNLKWEGAGMKVSQLAGYVAEHSMYHHGEASLYNAIVNLAQSFCGANNINVLYPEGQFGTRLQGGKDCASARYICTKLAKVARCIFHPDDDGILKYLEEDGQKIEPEWYIPIIPMVLVNGAEGIGTGWSTTIPNYNPRDIVANIKRMLEGLQPEQMLPWYKHFKGSIRMADGSEQEVTMAGLIEVDENDPNSVEITELPIKKWTSPYSDFLEDLINPPKETIEPILYDMVNFSTPASVRFELQVIPEKMAQIRDSQSFYKTFGLKTRCNLKNFVLFDADGKVARYKTAEDILREFFDVRIAFYTKRKDSLLNGAKYQLLKLNNRIRFVLAVANDELVVFKRKAAELEAELEAEGYDKIAASSEATPSYDYLLKMPIQSLTFEKVAALQAVVDEQKSKVAWWENITVKELWTIDLDKFLEVLDETEAEERREEEADEEEYRKRSKQFGRSKPKPRKKAVRATSENTDVTMPPPPRGGGRGGRGGKKSRGPSRANSAVSKDAPQQSGPSVKQESFRERMEKRKGTRSAAQDEDVDMDEVTSPLPPCLGRISECKTAERKTEQEAAAAAKEQPKPKKAPKRKVLALPSSSEEDSDDALREAKVSRMDLTGEGDDPIPEADVAKARSARPRRAQQPKPEATNLLTSDEDDSMDGASDDEKDSDFAPSD